MRTLGMFVGCAALTAVLAGCSPELAQTPLGSEEEGWQKTIQQSYPSWRAPRVAPPAIKDNMSPDFVEPAPAPAEEPAVDAIPAEAAPSAAVDLPAPAEEPAPAAAEVKEPVPPAEAAPAAAEVKYESYVVQKGDSLSLIARKFYKDGRKYFRILKANEAELKGNPNLLRPGMTLRIPVL